MIQSICPAIAGYVLAEGFDYAGMMMLCAVGTIGAVVTYSVVFAKLKVIAQEVADAD